MEDIVLNAHNKTEHPQNHTTEHLLNQTMNRLYKCGRAVNAHIEAKKSKCDYALPQAPSEDEVEMLEKRINSLIGQEMPVRSEYIEKEKAKGLYNLSKLPDDASDTLRIVHIGDYDACPCIGVHVENTREIGSFKIISSSYENGIWRVRWKTIQ